MVIQFLLFLLASVCYVHSLLSFKHNTRSRIERLKSKNLRLSSQKIDIGENDVMSTAAKYSELLYQWATSDRGDASQQMEEVFNKMLRAGFIPSTSLCRTLLETLGKSKKDGPERAERALDKLMLYTEDFSKSPATGLYNALIKSWICSERTDAFSKAEEIYERMEFADVEPDRETFSILIESWALGASNKQYKTLLSTMQNKGFEPSAQDYANLIIGISNSNDNEENILTFLRDLVIARKYTPTAIDYNNVVKSWAKSARDDVPAKVHTLYTFNRCSVLILKNEVLNTVQIQYLHGANPALDFFDSTNSLAISTQT